MSSIQYKIQIQQRVLGKNLFDMHSNILHELMCHIYLSSLKQLLEKG